MQNVAEKKVKYAVTKFENNVDFIPEYVEGIYDIPLLKPEPFKEAIWIPFPRAGDVRHNRDQYGIHFYTYDYQFTGIWNMREKYKEMLPQFKAIMTPDFSLYVDWPIMVQMWNHYRKHLIGAWLQSIGCTVYPVVRWLDELSYSWCFDGDPFGGTVCVSSISMMRNKELRRMFIDGYHVMLEVLEPETILFYGQIPKECTGNIVPIEPYCRNFKEVRNSNDFA
jgi:hypothetical protein